MTDFALIQTNYLNKLEPNKQYSLGSIFNRLVANNVDIDIVFLFLYIAISKDFSVSFWGCNGTYEGIKISKK